MILVCGFEPFGGRTTNRSWQAVLAMQSAIERVLLPVDYAKLEAQMPALVARGPAALLLVGEAARPRVTLERFARNACNPDRLDNTGAPRDLVRFGGPAVVEATWDVANAVAVASAHVAVEPSEDAGGFCCNFALYHALLAAPPTLPIGFVHVPIADDPPAPAIAAALDAIALAMVK